jgi:hypothetical protein
VPREGRAPQEKPSRLVFEGGERGARREVLVHGQGLLDQLEDVVDSEDIAAPDIEFFSAFF